MENNNLTSKVHTLKIDRQPCLDICSGAKTCEIRRDDRGFKVGDTVRLFEHVDGSPTGRQVARTISHIQRGYGLPAGMCILSYGVLKTATQAMLEHEEIQQRIRLGARQSGKSWLRQTTGLPCPNHGNSHCVQCFWPPRYEGAVFDKAILDEMICAPRPDAESVIAAAVHNTILYGTGAYTVQIADDRLTATAIKTGDYITDSGYDGFDNGVDE